MIEPRMEKHLIGAQGILWWILATQLWEIGAWLTIPAITVGAFSILLAALIEIFLQE